MSDDNRFIEFLAIAESDLHDLRRINDFVSDEAKLLRGCLAALVAIARLLHNQVPEETRG